MQGLLTSLAAEGFETLHRVTDAATADIDDPVERIQVLGEAYVGLARVASGRTARSCSGCDLVDEDDEHLQTVRTRGLRRARADGATVHRRRGADRPRRGRCLAVLVGDAGLVVIEDKLGMLADLRGGEPAPTRDLIRRFTAILVAGIRAA